MRSEFIVLVAAGLSFSGGCSGQPAASAAFEASPMLDAEAGASSRTSTPPSRAPRGVTTVMPEAGRPRASGQDRLAVAETCEASATLDLEIEGYGAGTVGGWQEGHDVVCVNSLEDDGPGTLRDACRTDGQPRIVRFAIDGDILLSSAISLPSNITVDGRGRDIAVVGKGFLIHGQHDIILTNLAIEDVAPDSEDGIQIGHPDLEPSSRIVLDHLRFSESGEGGNSAYVDEAISVIFGSHDITIAWCRFETWEKIMLFGNGDADASVDSAITVTVHHNYFDATGRRHPQARYGTFDVYNNYLDDWHMYDYVGPPIWHESFGVECEDACQLILEQNIFERHWHETDAFSDANKASECENEGTITDLGGWVTPETSVHLRFGVRCLAGDLERPYEATIDVADESLRQLLIGETGNVL